jgi:protein-tyrosine phosphatase
MSINVVFVCLGNICRSPMAEAIFQQMVNEAGLADEIQIDSSGTGAWHVGEPAHRGTRKILDKYNIPYNGRSRQVTAVDMAPDNYVIAMDDSNMRDLKRRFGEHPRLYRLLDFAQDTGERNVPDPYYTDNFDYVYQLVTDGCHGLLQTIRDENNL